MNHQDAEESDIIVILIDEPGMTTQDAVARLKAQGMDIGDVDEPNGAVEGTIATEKVASLRKLDFVKYVRDVFNYVADYPPGDPRNKDNDDDEDALGPDADDAGA